jgi:exodeoxyribonuclease VII large subunit
MSLFDSHRAGKPATQKPEERVLRVAELNRAVRGHLETRFGEVWVEGEIADFTRSAPGHLYFTLNDEQEPAQLRCVMFRSDAMRAKAKLGPGARVRLRGKPTLYEQRGTFQFVASVALSAGDGDLAAKLEQLKKKLDAEGLFALERKRALPRLPRVVGVVTSTSGAAMHDILRVSAGRSAVRIIVADCRVQGEGAPASIVLALTLLQRLTELDVIIIGRGGGSAEDLVAFQDEAVVRAIAACRVPIVSAVGHETDVTLADLVADMRAATPSNAAELVVPDRRLLERELDSWVRRLERAMDGVIDGERLRLERLQRELAEPRTLIASSRRRLDDARTRLSRVLPRKLASHRARLGALERRLGGADPRRRLAERRARLVALESALVRAMEQLIGSHRRTLAGTSARVSAHREMLTSDARERLASLAGKLDALSPLAVLTRGYAIVTGPSGKAVVDANAVTTGDRLVIRLARGRVEAVTTAVETPGDETS